MGSARETVYVLSAEVINPPLAPAVKNQQRTASCIDLTHST